MGGRFLTPLSEMDNTGWGSVARILNEAAQDSEDTELRAELCRIPAFRGGQKGDELTQSLSRRDQEVGKSQEEASWKPVVGFHEHECYSPLARLVGLSLFQ